MANQPARIRKPVRREGAEKFLLLSLVSFAASVSLTRLFLELTGYPQIGNGELHIAHVLWGGLLLYIAALLPILYANRWALSLSGILSGIGIGLFIDEVGKFITQTNDYFYPPAAPIIYAFFLLSVLLFNRIRSTRMRDVRSELYRILDGLGEVLDHDLSESERANLIRRLDEIIAQSPAPDLVRLAQAIKDFIAHEQLTIVPDQPGLLERTRERVNTWQQRWIDRRKFQAGLAGASLALALWILYYPMFTMMRLLRPEALVPVINELVLRQVVRSPSSLNWFEARVALELSVGLILLVGAALIFGGKDKRGSALIYLGLLLSLTTVNLLVFYFDQFSSIVNALVQFVLLLAVLYYRKLYLSNSRLE